MPRTTVRDYCQRAQAAGLDSFAAIEPQSERALEARLFTTGVDRDAPDPDTAGLLAGRPTPDWAVVHRELKKPGVTRRLLWHECTSPSTRAAIATPSSPGSTKLRPQAPLSRACAGSTSPAR